MLAVYFNYWWNHSAFLFLTISGELLAMLLECLSGVGDRRGSLRAGGLSAWYRTFGFLKFL